MSCGTKPIEPRSAASGHSFKGFPSKYSSLSGASHKRAINAAKVVLPLPVGPTIASVDPAGIFKSMFCSTGCEPFEWLLACPLDFVAAFKSFPASEVG